MNPNDSRPIKGRSLRLAKSLPLCLFTVALLASRSPAAENSHSATASNAYTFTPISLCASCSTLPIGVAANGLISGLYFDAIGNLHAFVARNGNYLTVDVPGALFTEAGRSNEPGQTAGDYLAADGIDRPFVRNRDGSFSLRNGAPGASVTIGNDINNRGDVLGWFTTDPNGQTGFQGYVLRGNNYILTFAYPEADVTNTFAVGFNQAGTIVVLSPPRLRALSMALCGAPTAGSPSSIFPTRCRPRHSGSTTPAISLAFTRTAPAQSTDFSCATDNSLPSTRLPARTHLLLASIREGTSSALASPFPDKTSDSWLADLQHVIAFSEADRKL